MAVQGGAQAGQGLRIGDTFLNQNPGSPEHLWVVAAGPTTQGEFVIFNLTSWREGCDESCVVQAGEHPFIAHKSVIAYARGQFLSDTNWALLLRYGCKKQAPVSPGLLKKIQEGALASEFTAGKFQSAIRAAVT